MRRVGSVDAREKEINRRCNVQAPGRSVSRSWATQTRRKSGWGAEAGWCEADKTMTERKEDAGQTSVDGRVEWVIKISSCTGAGTSRLRTRAVMGGPCRARILAVRHNDEDLDLARGSPWRWEDDGDAAVWGEVKPEDMDVNWLRDQV